MRQVLVCQYTSCSENGSADVLANFQANPVADVELVASECQGQCSIGPTVRVLPDQIWYCRVKPEDVVEIIEQHLRQGKPVLRLLHPRFHPKF